MQNQTSKDWQKVKVEDIVDVYGGGTPSTKIRDYWDGEIPWLTPAELTNYDSRTIAGTASYITESGLKNSSAKLMPESSILLTSRATIGNVTINTTPMATNQGFINIEPKNVDQDFFYYWLKDKRKYLNQIAIGSTFPELSKSVFKQIETVIPKSENEQRKIGKLLSTFDDKIEVNNKIADTLTQIAQAIFKEWFVNFKFPAHEKVVFVDSELGKIPKGWERKTLGSIANNYDRKRKPLSNMERVNRKGNYPYYGATEIMDYIDGYIFNGEYLLIAEDGSVETDNGKAVIQFVVGKFWVNNHAHIIQGTKETPTFYLYLLFKHISIKPYITGAVQLKLTQENLNKIAVIVPPASIMIQFTKIAYPMILKIRQANNENQKLAALRDLLLPKLMKGEVRV